jgi:phospholipase C
MMPPDRIFGLNLRCLQWRTRVGTILPQVKNIVVVMFENRSFDNICGWLYSEGNQPGLYLPTGSPQKFDGLDPKFWNPSNASYFDGYPPLEVPAVPGTSDYTVPNPDPEETFDNVTYQLYGPQDPSASPRWPMQGFVVNYANAASSMANQLMEGYLPSQVPVISQLAQNYALSDAWFCSVPSQTLPNRCFVHAGTSNGNVNNGDLPNPFEWNVSSIFNVLHSMGISWAVYSDAILTPSLTRTFFPKLWDPSLDDHFKGFGAFQAACATDSLPQYSFIEPMFLLDPNDEHPPHDISKGEQFLFQIWQAVSQSPGWNNILLIITYDEHGGCYDHVLPRLDAAIPDAASDPGKEGFRFNRFGVRVPTVVVSPFIQAGTVFRSNTNVPYDHTSIPATLRDWLPISAMDMLPSKRIDQAPNLSQVLNLSNPRTVKPTITPPRSTTVQTSLTLPPNDLQKTLVAGAAYRFGMDAPTVLAQIKTRQHAVDFFKQRISMARL